jgi:hypothetical protein
MLRNTFLSVLTVLTVAAATQAAVTISGNMATDGVATPGLAGFKTYTITANSDDPITAVDFVGAGDNDPGTGRGFFGAMNQLTPPGGLSTVFQDANALIPILIPGANAQQDSQFSVLTAGVVVPPGLAEESGTLLQGAWAWSSPQGLSLPFAQIVIPDSNTNGVAFRGAITALVNGVQTDFNVSGTVGGGAPVTPPVVVDVNLGNRIRGGVITHQFTTSQGSAPITFGNLVSNGPGPLSNAPTLTGAGAFSWNSAGTNPLGTYTFDVTAMNAGGSDVGRLTVNLIPEPATVTMIGLAMIGFVGLGLRKRS